MPRDALKTVTTNFPQALVRIRNAADAPNKYVWPTGMLVIYRATDTLTKAVIRSATGAIPVIEDEGDSLERTLDLESRSLQGVLDGAKTTDDLIPYALRSLAELPK
jgi:hypothetical protein